MRVRVQLLAILILCSTALLVRAGVSVSSFDTQAEANAYAPLDQSAYFSTDDKPNVSPAIADVSADWMGTNVGGSTSTWEMLASSHISTSTTATANALS